MVGGEEAEKVGEAWGRLMTGKKDILAALSPQEASAVLGELTKDSRMRRRAEEIALARAGAVDADAIADEVLWELDLLDVHDVWDDSGPTRDGYVDSGECAWEMFEKALKPFEDQLRKCHQLSLARQAKDHCMGILQGIWRFESESKSEFKDWAEDAPKENMTRIFGEWRKMSKSPKDIAQVKRLMDSLLRKGA